MKPSHASILAALALALAGCSSEDFDNPEHAAENYTCTPEQMQRATSEAETAIRIDAIPVQGKSQPQQHPRYWYGAAIMRVCTWRGKTAKGKQP